MEMNMSALILCKEDPMIRPAYKEMDIDEAE